MPLILQVTAAGRAALVNAQNTGTLPVLVAKIGVTAQAFTAASDGSDLVLPGELKQLSTFAGSVVADDTIHVTIRDDSADQYSMRGFALYLDNGTLLALYGQADPILEKSTQAMLLLATDTIFADIAATSLTFGDASFINPPATTEQVGVVELATDAEATAGADGTRAVTPAALTAAMDGRFGVGAPSAFFKGLMTSASAAVLRAALAIKSAAMKDEGAGNGLDADLLDGQHGSYYRAWANLTGVPASFTPSAHAHLWADITNPPATATRWPDWTEVTGKPATFAPAPHSHVWTDITNPPATATRWPAWSEVTSKPVTFPPDPHTHVIADVTGLQAALDAKASLSGAKFTGTLAVMSQGVGMAQSYWDQANTVPRFYVSHNDNSWSFAVCNDAGAFRAQSWIVNRADGALTFVAPATINNNTYIYGNTFFLGQSVCHVRSGATDARITFEDSAGLRRSVAACAPSSGVFSLVLYGTDGGTEWSKVVLSNGRVDVTGTLYATGGFVKGSSRTIKRDIEDLPYGLAELARLRAVRYRYRPEFCKDGRQHLGVIAEELREVIPEPVLRGSDSVPTAVDYDQLVPLLIRCTQELAARAEAAEARAVGMARELQELAARMRALELRA